jgi:hypothetical protein
MNKTYQDCREPKERGDLARKMAIRTPYLLQQDEEGRIELWEVLPDDNDCSNPVFTGMTFGTVEHAYAWACPDPGVHISIRYE